MPVIKKDDQQMQALADIESALNTVGAINSIIGDGNDNAELQIVLAPEKGRAVKVSFGEKISLPKQELTRLNSALTTLKQRLVKDINTKAAKYRIELSADDLKCMGEDAEPSASETED